jgi:hypothetical protein
MFKRSSNPERALTDSVEFRVLVCGGRNYSDRKKFISTMDAIDVERQITLIIQGGASGADSLAKLWALRAAVPYIEFRADWNKNGRAAGPLRNQKMIDQGRPDLVVAFQGGRGTSDMMRRARTAKIPVREIPES